MATVTEDYCSFELAKLLKEKGFNEPCYRWYDNKGAVCAKFINPDIPLDYSSREYYLCPSQSVAMKWLREVHKLEITPFHEMFQGDSWWYRIERNTSLSLLVEYEEDSIYGSYEQACNTAVLYCLENLI